MADDRKEGLAAAIEQLGPGEVPGEAVEQLGLFGGALEPAPDGEGAAQLPDRPRGPGRPPGARNKRTEEWTEYLAGRYGSPLERLAKIYSAPLEEIRNGLKCTWVEAQGVQIEAAKAALPYMHQKQPVAVQIDESGRVQVEFLVSPAMAQAINRGAAGDGAIVIEGEILNSEDDEKSDT